MKRSEVSAKKQDLLRKSHKVKICEEYLQVSIFSKVTGLPSKLLYTYCSRILTIGAEL